MLYAIDEHGQLFFEEFTPEALEAHSGLLSYDIKRYRVKTIKSGKMLEYECYPLWEASKRKRAKKEKETKPTQKNLNDKNAIKRLIRLINTNFTNADTWATFTYSEEHLPKSYEEAKRHMTNYLRRLKAKLKKLGRDEIKYIYVTEYDPDSTKKVRIHHHIVMNVQDRDMIEAEWKYGARTQARRLQADENEYEGLARYILKDPHGKKRYTCSRNLKQPTITLSDYKLSRKKAHDIVMDQNSAKDIFEKMAKKKYRFLDLKIYVSDFIDGVYLHATLRLKEDRGRHERKRKTAEHIRLRNRDRWPRE